MDPFKGPGWCKFYADGSEYYATDPELRRKAKSWRNSRFEDMTMVMIRDKNLNTARIKGLGEFWQSDLEWAQMVINKTVPGVTMNRRIQKKITSYDKAILITKKHKETFAEFLPSIPPPPTQPKQTLFIITPDEHIDMWFVLETDLKTNSCDYYLSPGKI